MPPGAAAEPRAAVDAAVGEQPSGEAVPPARWRAERRALRLYLCAPTTCDLLGQLELSDPLHREALSCLRQLRQRLPVAPDGDGADGSGLDPLAAVVLSLCPRLDPPLAGLLLELVRCGPEARRLLQADPVPELQVVLELLEPVG